jgi:hypothetical protein
MTDLPLGKQSYERLYGRMPEIKLVNRFFETNPTNRVEGVALLTRPGTRFQKQVGSGRIRKIFWQDGAFGNDLFVVAGTSLYRYDPEADTVEQILGTIQGDGTPDMAVVVGPGFEHLFIADGLLLQVYTGTGFATGTLTLGLVTGGPNITTQTVRIGSVYYQWTSGSVDTGTPDGSSGAPFLVATGGDDTASLENLASAINADGTPGTTYSTALTGQNTIVSAVAEPLSVEVTSRTTASSNNSVATTVTGSALSWDNSTLSGAGVETLIGVAMPDGRGASQVTSLNGFALVTETNAQRVYFVRPGEITIEANDFFAAEDESDEIVTIRQVGDSVAILGQNSIEFWYATGDTTPGADTFLPVSGRVFSLGVLPGSVVRIRDVIMFVGNDDKVYALSGQPEPLQPNHGISERIRRARAAQREA